MGDMDHRLRLAADPARSRPALFLDRDGTLIEHVEYLADPERVHLVPGAGEVLRRFRDAGHALVVATNQSGIGRGLFGWAEYDAVADRVRDRLAAEGIVLDAELVCAHDPAGGSACGWRKPAPGMLLEAARLLDLDLATSTMVGDRLSDLEAGAAAGVGRLVHVASGHGEADRPLVRAWDRPVAEFSDISALRP